MTEKTTPLVEAYRRDPEQFRNMVREAVRRIAELWRRLVQAAVEGARRLCAALAEKRAQALAERIPPLLRTVAVRPSYLTMSAARTAGQQDAMLYLQHAIRDSQARARFGQL